MITLPELKQELRRKETKRYYRRVQGEIGEKWAVEYLSQGELEFVPIEASRFDKPEELADRGGKRADYIVETHKAIVLLDAKHHQTRDCTWFGLPEDEISAFQIGQEFAKELLIKGNDARTVHTFMMVFPKECKGTRLVFISLSELVNGTPCVINDKLWRSVDLTKLASRWDDHKPLIKPAYD